LSVQSLVLGERGTEWLKRIVSVLLPEKRRPPWRGGGGASDRRYFGYIIGSQNFSCRRTGASFTQEIEEAGWGKE